MVDAAVARKNCLLAALPPATLQRWLPQLDEQVLRLGAQVHGSAAARRYVHFPTTALVSMLHVMHDGASAEIAVIGNDGVVGMLLLMGGDATSTFGVVQGGGKACRLPLDVLAGEFARGGEVMQRVAQAAGRLQRKGVIRYMRGHITILDRAALEANACECYAALNAQLGRTQVARAVH